MLSTIFEYNWIIINDLADFGWVSYVSLTEVWWLSGSDISMSNESIVDSHNVIDYPWFMQWRIITLWWGIIWKTETDVISKINELNRAFSVPSYYRTRLDWYRDLVFYKKWATDAEKYLISVRIKKLPRFDKTMHIHRKRWFYTELFSESAFIKSYLETTHILDWVANFTLPATFPWSLIKSNTDKLVNNWNCAATTKIKLTWPFKSFEMENLTNGQKFVMIWLDIPDWEYIEIDWENWKVYKNWDEEDDLSDFISLTSEWIFLDALDNDIVFRWSDLTWNVNIPSCEVKYHNSYNNIEI